MRSALIGLAAIACGGPNLPVGVECGGVNEVGPNAGLVTAQSSAVEGDCILLSGGSYNGPIVLPAGVRLVGEADAVVQISGGIPAVIRGAEGGGIHNLTILSGPAQGILIEAIEFTVDRTQVFDIVESAVGIRCEDPGCLRGRITLDGLEIRRARDGLVVLGADVLVKDSVVSDASTTGLAGGGAIYVANGGIVTLEGTEVADSDYGVVADGAGTELHLVRTTVRDCAAAGVWTQGLSGTAAQPALTLGETTSITGHAGVGVLMLDSAGASIADSTIEGTTLRTTVLGGMNVEIGDGLLLVSASEVSVQASVLSGNARAQAIVDAAGAAVVFGSNTVDATGGQWKVVVQNGGIPATVPAADLSSAPLLAVPGDPIVVPTLGP